jgi:hypothetical protein
MHAPESLVVLAGLITLVGVGWLLSSAGLLPEINWVWVGLLALAGVLTIALGGVDRFTLTVGPFLLAAALASALRQSGTLTARIEMPALVVVFGVLMLANLLLPIPNPQWTTPPKA